MAAPVVRASPLAAFQARARRCLEGRQPQLCEQALIVVATATYFVIQNDQKTPLG